MVSFYIFLHSSIPFRWWFYLTDNSSGFHCVLFNYLLNCDWILKKPTEMSHWAYSILLAQLMATLIHNTFTPPLSGLVDWSAFLEQRLPTL